MADDRPRAAQPVDEYFAELVVTPGHAGEGGDEEAGPSTPRLRAVSSTVLVRQRAAAIAAIRKIVKEAGSLDPTTTDVEVMEQLDRLEHHYSRFCAAHEGILRVTGKAELYFQQIEKDAILPVYEDGKATFERLLIELEERTGDVSAADEEALNFIRSRNLAKSRITRIRLWLESGGHQHATAEELEDRLQHLQEMWTAFYTAHDNVLLCVHGNPDAEQQELDEVEDNAHFRCHDSQMRCRWSSTESIARGLDPNPPSVVQDPIATQPNTVNLPQGPVRSLGIVPSHHIAEVEDIFFTTKSLIRRMSGVGRHVATTVQHTHKQLTPKRGMVSELSAPPERAVVAPPMRPANLAMPAPPPIVAAPAPPQLPEVPELLALGGAQVLPLAGANHGQQLFRLPTIELPRFGGNYAEWTSFRDRFTCLIGLSAVVSNVNKLHYLKSCVDGEAATLVRAYPITERNFAPAWAALMERYDHTRLVVNTHLQAIFDAESSQADSASSLRSLGDVFAENVAMLSGLNEPTDAWDSVLVFLAVRKLDVESARQWETSLAADARPTFREFQRFVEVRCRALEAVERNRPYKATMSDTKASQQGRRNPFNSASALTATVEDLCPLCAQPHRLYACQRFNSMTVTERKTIVVDKRLCFNCLCTSHMAMACTRSSCRTCQQRHHTLLHAERRAAETHEAANAHTCVAEPRGETLLATANVLVTAADGTQHVIRALIDPAATSSFVTEECVQRFRLKRTAAAVPVTGIGQAAAVRTTGIATVRVGSVWDKQFAVDIRAFVLRTITAPLPASRLPDSVTLKFADVRLADPQFHVPRKVDLLLGAKVFEAIWCDGTIPSDRTGPCGKLTVFGWVAIGSWTTEGGLGSRPRAMLSVDDHLQLEEQVRQFWEVEEMPQTRPRTAEEAACELHYDNNTTRDDDGRYVVRLPFAPVAKPLGQSRSNAVKSMLVLEKRFRRDPELKGKYVSFMRDYKQMGHMEPAYGSPSSAYYLPHLAVVTTKMRVVFDASRRTSSGMALNDNLMAGPRLQDGLLDIVLRFRCRRVAFTSDIAKMYRQIKMGEEHRDFQRILWREEENDVLREYRLTTVTYGTASAPFLAVRTLQKLAEDESGRFPRAARVLSSDFYVDDLMTGCDDEEEAAELRKELELLLAAGGFVLRKWAASHLSALSGVSEGDREPLTSIDVGAAPFVKTLGLYWCPGPDELQFRIATTTDTRASHTKRSVLSDVSKLFDPLGLLTPVVIVAKIFVQSLWKEAIGWNDELREPLSRFWSGFRSELASVQALRVPRWVGAVAKDADRTEIHGFCDASEKAYCAVLYVRSVHSQKSVVVRVLAAKSRVAPLKQLTVPRLELCGAHLLGRLLKACKHACGLDQAKCYLWTDSELVLWYLTKQPADLKTFVRHRVSDIIESTQGAAWRHVPSGENPADIGSRGVSPSAIGTQTRWWNGPTWLTSDTEAWPAPWTKTKAEPDHCQSVTALHASPETDSWCERYPDLQKLLCVTATMIRFAGKCRNNSVTSSGSFSAAELSTALEACVRLAQAGKYADERKACAAKRPILASSELSSLAPYLDDAGVLRLGGRLQNSALDHDQMHQIILPPKSHLSRLIVWDVHVRTLHGAVQLTMATLRQRFWMIGMRREVTSIIHTCMRCFRWRQRNRQHQLMGSLPSPRVTPNRPFLVTGVDFAGPILIRSSTLRGNRTQKAYISVFVCFSTRAIHLELVSDLTSAAFIAALHRFVSRRGLCAEMHSDCGTNFVGANAELRVWRKEVAKQIADANPARVLADMGTEWRFIPPGSPTFGGLWESAVKSTKHHLRRVLTDAPLTFEGMSTVLTQVEACLNSRPLSAMSDNPDDLCALTPGHFLIGEPLNAIPHPDVSSVPSNRLSRWQYAQQLVQHFWGRWQREYMATLQARGKWRTAEPSLAVGDLVLMVDEQRSPTKWPLGRIEQLFPGADGHVRVASVRTAGPSGSVRRTIRKLCRLPVPANDE